MKTQYDKILKEESGSVYKKTENISNIYCILLYFLWTLAAAIITVRV